MTDLTEEQLEQPAWLDDERSRRRKRHMVWRLGQRPEHSIRVSDFTLTALWREVRGR